MMLKETILTLVLTSTIAFSDQQKGVPKTFEFAFDTQACRVKNQGDEPTFHKKVKPLKLAELGKAEFHIRTRIVQKGLEPTEWAYHLPHKDNAEGRYSIETPCPTSNAGYSESKEIYQGKELIGGCVNHNRKDNPKYVHLRNLLRLDQELTADVDDTGPYLSFIFFKEIWSIKVVRQWSLDKIDFPLTDYLYIKEKIRPRTSGNFSFNLITNHGEIVFSTFEGGYNRDKLDYKKIPFTGSISSKCFQANTEVISEDISRPGTTMRNEFQIGVYVPFEK